ncbi:MAG: hypothetical protein D6B26_01555 [Spirochaetaceae bacterium]|nr:MAG: hypothetical protein D6B26_01555 [Spirochaetaceae bacterium]
MRLPSLRLLVIISFLLLGNVIFAQVRLKAFDEPATIIPPVGYSATREYPVLVFLPYTTGTSEEQARAFGVIPGEQKDFFLVLPAGRFMRDDYLPDFMQFVRWYEQRLLIDLESTMAQYSIDSDRIYLAGYSLGGDLAWALSVRNPYMFAGAVMAGTRASYPISETDRADLKNNGFRAAFAIGDQDAEERTVGIDRAYRTLVQDDMPAVFETYPGGHEQLPKAMALEMIAYITGETVKAGDQGSGGLRFASGSGQGGLGKAADVAKSIILREPSLNFGLKYEPFFELGSEGLMSARRHSLQFRAEGLFDDIYLRGLTTLESRNTTTAYSLRGVRQEVAVGFGRNSMWGAGFGWDWHRWMNYSGEGEAQEGDAQSEFNLSAFWIHPRRMRGIPASVLQFRYNIPRFLNPFAAAALFNGELLYHLHVTEGIMLSAAVGSYLEQNRPYDDQSRALNALDHVLYWQAAFSFRAPGSLRWYLGHTGRHVEQIGRSDGEYGGVWRIAVEYLY